jgi:hypothetical protein
MGSESLFETVMVALLCDASNVTLVGETPKTADCAGPVSPSIHNKKMVCCRCLDMITLYLLKIDRGDNTVGVGVRLDILAGCYLTAHGVVPDG